jgi:hypothetical protein
MFTSHPSAMFNTAHMLKKSSAYDQRTVTELLEFETTHRRATGGAPDRLTPLFRKLDVGGLQITPTLDLPIIANSAPKPNNAWWRCARSGQCNPPVES